MDGLLRVENQNLPTSSSSYLGDDTTSTCALITPSPPTNALVNPPPEEEESGNFIDAETLATKLKHVKDIDQSDKKSSSTSNSSLAEPSCTTLLNNNCNHYLHIQKDEETVTQEAPGKTQPLQMTFRNPPENYFFMKWNWILIRKISAWIFLSGMVGMLAMVIAMIWNLPKTCNPTTHWYQGNLMYEILPASYLDSNEDGIGDFKGLSLKTDYFQSLGVRILRLNSIFPSKHYPEDYKNITSLTEVASQLGSIEDFHKLVNALHTKNISIVLDLPLWPYLHKIGTADHKMTEMNQINSSNTNKFQSSSELTSEDQIKETIEFWLEKGVDGFYLKGLENFVLNDNFPKFLRHWKKLMGQERVLIVSKNFIDLAPQAYLNTIYNNIDLVDVRLPVEDVQKLSKYLTKIFNSTLFSKPSMPWILWTLGDESTPRLADRLPFGNGTLGATLFQLMLPGTPCIFYGDEIGLKKILDPHNDRKDLKHLHHLVPMQWEYPRKQFTGRGILAWMHGIQTASHFDQLKPISNAITLRQQSPSIYINSVYREGVNKVNAEIKYANNEMLVIQRWYPRRKSYAVLSNLGHNRITVDLSKLLYLSDIVIGPGSDSNSDSISFKSISLWPGESVIVLVS